MAIENMKLMHVFCPQHCCMNAEMSEYGKKLSEHEMKSTKSLTIVPAYLVLHNYNLNLRWKKCMHSIKIEQLVNTHCNRNMLKIVR